MTGTKVIYIGIFKQLIGIGTLGSSGPVGITYWNMWGLQVDPESGRWQKGQQPISILALESHGHRSLADCSP